DAVQVAAAAPPPAGLQGGGFESPAVGGGSFRYDPAGTAWTYSGLAGVAANGSGFTARNAAAPEGAQVAFLQSTGSLAQTFNLAAGTYAVTFQAAQRVNYQSSAQTFRVLVDGAAVGTFTPAGAAYGSYATAAISLAAGTHTLTFEGLNPNGGDNTAFLDQVQLGVV
ncbi:MAG TPA: hypothetical protein VL371_04450, partial [Gemmataceae bacterium]|nr:hypothetical protein [Gemmataceae bacterium]